MTIISQYLNRNKSLFFGLAAIGPLLLLSNRLIYALAVSLILLIYISCMFLLRPLIMITARKELCFSIELFAAAIVIAIIDILMTAYLPLLRADFGILLPFIFIQGKVFLSSFPEAEREGKEKRMRASSEQFKNVYGKLFTYITMMIVLSVCREALSHGMISMLIQPWKGVTQAGGLTLFSSTTGLLFLFTALYMIKEDR